MFQRAIWVWLLVLALGGFGRDVLAADGPVVMIEGGRVAGRQAGDVISFMGVPYAAPPMGDMRWRPPARVVAWQGIRSALQSGPDCLQDSRSNPLDRGYENVQSEDCLYLNLWRPRRVSGRPLAVMVWIHGGAFIMGSGSMPSYDGAFLARQGVMVVSINYRLGRFGTFAHPALDAAQGGLVANYGLMDQIAALRWVRDNIARFGGDPRNVTIFGESAGASSVNFLMASSMARGLFAKAISESGGSSANLRPLRGGPTSAEAVGLAWARSKGVADGDVAALRALPASVVLDAPVTVPFFPVVDGEILQEDTPTSFAAGHEAHVPYLLGANDYEENLLRWLPGASQALLSSLGDRAAPLLALYTRRGEDPTRAAQRLWGENAMTLPARWRAARHASRAPTWLYRYAYVPDMLRATTPGAGHEAEMEMVFGNPSRRTSITWSTADRSMAKALSAYWVSFAKTGSPNHAGAPPWRPFRADADRLMMFDATGPHMVARFAKQRLDALDAASSPH